MDFMVEPFLILPHCSERISSAGVLLTFSILFLQLQPTDQFAVIASDGLWNVMSSEEVVDFVVEAKAEIDAADDVMGREEGAMDADEEEEDDSGSSQDGHVAWIASKQYAELMGPL